MTEEKRDEVIAVAENLHDWIEEFLAGPKSVADCENLMDLFVPVALRLTKETITGQFQ